MQWAILIKPQYLWRNVHHRLSVFWVWFQPKKLSIFRDLIFFLYLGTHLSKTGDELVYYYLYHEIVSFSLDIRHQLFYSDVYQDKEKNEISKNR